MCTGFFKWLSQLVGWIILPILFFKVFMHFSSWKVWIKVLYDKKLINLFLFQQKMTAFHFVSFCHFSLYASFLVSLSPRQAAPPPLGALNAVCREKQKEITQTKKWLRNDICPCLSKYASVVVRCYSEEAAVFLAHIFGLCWVFFKSTFEGLSYSFLCGITIDHRSKMAIAFTIYCAPTFLESVSVVVGHSLVQTIPWFHDSCPIVFHVCRQL